MAPDIGQVVHYLLSEDDAYNINARRIDDESSIHRNPVEAGEVVPMMVVKVWGDNCVNGQAILDGDDSLWASSVVRGGECGCWFKPGEQPVMEVGPGPAPAPESEPAPEPASEPEPGEEV